MVYKKYIQKGGKSFGPYYYESYRENGKVKTRFVSGPKKKNKKHTKKLPYILLAIVLIFCLIYLIGIVNYGFTGRVSDVEIKEEIDRQIAMKISEEGLTSDVDDITEEVSIRIDPPIRDGLAPPTAENKPLYIYSSETGRTFLTFELLNYQKFVDNDIEEKVAAENFDVTVQGDTEKYKLGYSVKLNSIEFLAKISILSENGIKVIDESTFKMGDNYLSFADLTKQGYTLTLNEPIILDKPPAEPEEPVELPTSNVYVPEVLPISNNYVYGQEILRTNSGGFFSRGMNYLKNLISRITGKYTGFVIDEESLVIFYIQKDFSNEGYNTGEIINLDPVLVRIVEPEKLVSLEEISEPPVEIPEEEVTELEEECLADWECADWSECQLIYNLKEIIDNGVFLNGVQTRECKDVNKCFVDKVEERNCELKKEITTKGVFKCKNYIEIRDENGVLINRLEMTEEPDKKLDIQLLIGEEYYPYCFDKIKNCDEDEVDCVYEQGGSCPVC